MTEPLISSLLMKMWLLESVVELEDPDSKDVPLELVVLTVPERVQPCVTCEVQRVSTRIHP